MANTNSSKTAVASVIFPANLEFFREFLQSISRQTEKDFELVLFNDGCDPKELKGHLDYFPELRHSVVGATKGSPSEIRIELIEYLKSEQYEVLIFADTDDFFSADRVELAIKAIKNNADIVVNDLSLVSKEGKLIQDRVWAKRFPGLNVDLDFLMRQNVLGLGNTAIKTKLLGFEIQVDKDIPFFDWIFYLQVFHHRRNISCATSDAITYYRQHESNMLGLGAEITPERLNKLWDIKSGIYSFAKKISLPKIEFYISEHRRFKKEVLENASKTREHISKLNNLENLFWFEEINA